MKTALLAGVVGVVGLIVTACTGDLGGPSTGSGDGGTAGNAGGAGNDGSGASSSGNGGGSNATGNGGSSNATGNGGSGGGDSGGGGESGGSAGSGGESGGSGGGAAGTGGGSGGCVENLGCQLDPPASTGDLHQDCVNRVNQFRTECACLEPLERWTEGEACADRMAQYDSEQDEAHAGFRDEICDGGFGQNECPGYRSSEQVVSRCLQQMWNEGPPPQDPCNGDCFQMYGHFINMTNPRNTRVACGFFTTAGGEVWAVQNFAR